MSSDKPIAPAHVTGPTTGIDLERPCSCASEVMASPCLCVCHDAPGNHPDSLAYEDVPWGEIAAHEADLRCEHKRVEKDDDGRDYWFYVCLDCDETVQLSDPDEDGKCYWEVVP